MMISARPLLPLLLTLQSASTVAFTFVPPTLTTNVLSCSSHDSSCHARVVDFRLNARDEIKIDAANTVKPTTKRRQFLQSTAAVATTIATSSFPLVSIASDETQEEFTKQGKGYAYKITPPPGFSQSKKPVKTHLDEVIFSLEGVRGYTVGITVDPVRLSSLSEFGTPEEIAARIVTAEVNRDGVFKVTLYKDPAEDSATGAYEIDYVSDGKRGTKHFVTRTLVKDGMLYVLTGQVKQEEFEDREKELLSSINTFQLV